MRSTSEDSVHRRFRHNLGLLLHSPEAHKNRCEFVNLGLRFTGLNYDVMMGRMTGTGSVRKACAGALMTLFELALFRRTGSFFTVQDLATVLLRLVLHFLLARFGRHLRRLAFLYLLGFLRRACRSVVLLR